MNPIGKEAEALRDQLIADRRVLHQCPEIGMDLPETTAYVKKRLLEMGISPQACGPSGITALIGDPSAGKTILLRGDMDALPAAEENHLPFKAKGSKGHLCGHDMHTAMLLGAAQLLKNHQHQLHGAVRLMFQPGEEVGEGAQSMIDAGILENPKVDAAVAIHVFPFLKAGSVAYVKGVATAAMDSFHFKFHGKGGHSSQPQNCIDPLMMVNSLYFQLSGLVSREVAPTETAVLSVGKMGGGDAFNIIPDTADLHCGLRSFDSQVREFLCQRILELADSCAASLRGSCEIVSSIRLPSVVNDNALADRLIPALEAVLGSENVLEYEKPLSGSEDFSYVSLKVPSFFLQLGALTEGNDVSLHNPHVLLNEDALPCGAALYANCALEYLK